METLVQTDSPIYVAGHRGMVGSAIARRLHDAGHRNVVTNRHTRDGRGPGCTESAPWVVTGLALGISAGD